MSSNKGRDEAGAKFTFGVREMRATKLSVAQRLEVRSLSLVKENRGSDPYNTSGSFDRGNPWTRVGKR